MSLVELVDNTRTDKNTVHSYLDLYERLLQSKKLTAKNVLEIGIWAGGSIKLWHDYFPNAIVHALDRLPLNEIWPRLRQNKRIKLYTSIDAYDERFFNMNLKNIKFDMVLDDGPHTIDSMKQFIILYSQLLADDGILILEDIQSIEWVKILIEVVPENLKKFVEIYDLRENKGRYDDIVLVINKH
jgi:hypothetical protein